MDATLALYDAHISDDGSPSQPRHTRALAYPLVGTADAPPDLAGVKLFIELHDAAGNYVTILGTREQIAYLLASCTEQLARLAAPMAVGG